MMFGEGSTRSECANENSGHASSFELQVGVEKEFHKNVFLHFSLTESTGIRRRRERRKIEVRRKATSAKCFFCFWSLLSDMLIKIATQKRFLLQQFFFLSPPVDIVNHVDCGQLIILKGSWERKTQTQKRGNAFNYRWSKEWVVEA